MHLFRIYLPTPIKSNKALYPLMKNKPIDAEKDKVHSNKHRFWEKVILL